MHSGGVFQTSAKFQKHKQHNHIPEKSKKAGQKCNHVINTKYENNLAEIYNKQYGHLCNHIPSAIPYTSNMILQKKNEVTSSLYKKCVHMNKLKDSPNRNVNFVTTNPSNFGKIQPNTNYLMNGYKNTSQNLNVKDFGTWGTNYFNTSLNTNFAPQIFKIVSPQNPNAVVQKINDTEQAKRNEGNLKLINKQNENVNKNKQSRSPVAENVNVSQQQKIIPNLCPATEVHTICTVNNQNVDDKKKKEKSPSPEKKKVTAPLPQKKNVEKNNQITELYKRPVDNTNGPNDSTGDLQTSFLSTNKLESASFQKVTEDLTNIIKNLQKQIHEVSITKLSMEQVPSAMIQPKNKEFFKTAKENNLNIKPPEPKAAVKKPETKNNTNISKKVSKGSSSSLRSLAHPKTIRTSTSNISRKSSSQTHQSLASKASTVSSRKSQRSTSSLDPLKTLKDEVQKAMRDHKTFTVCGRYPVIRRALVQRGWVEKFHASYKTQINEAYRRYQNYPISELLLLMKNEDLTGLCKNLIKSKLLGGYQVDLFWAYRDEGFKENSDKIKLTTINKLKRDIFSYTNKQGLCDASKYSHWYQKPNVSKLNHPRTYSLAAKNGDINEFTNDFNRTAAMSLLKWIVKTNITKECKLISPTGKVPLEAFEFALNECCKWIKKAKHEDIDMYIPEASSLEWSQFLDYFYKIVHYSNHFHKEDKETEESLVRKSNYVLNSLQDVWPFLEMDGMMNIWIMKPSASCMGRGIHMCRTLQYALNTIKQNTKIRYIIQKYIERPLLIHNTKFDIRQWFLISNCSPLTIWMYKQCYLRFSSQTYNLRKLHESIHLTNNSVQSKYKNNSIDAVLPNYNMWDSNEFQKYLTNIGYPNAYKELVYPEMKQCITASILMHQDKMIIRKNCFELYGADFILTENFKPWLLEINSNPALHASTPVTARMCPKVQEDVIKVIIDYGRNIKASTGEFEMIYKEQLIKLPETSALELKGKALKKDYFHSTRDEEITSLRLNTPVLVDQKQVCLKSFGEEIKKTLKNLLEIIHKEKHKRQLQKSVQNSTSCGQEQSS